MNSIYIIKNRYRCIIALIVGVFMLAIPTKLLSQEAYQYHSKSSPSASGIISADYFPMDYYTGRANINIPLYSLSSKGKNMSIGLSYNSGGVRVNDPNGWVGQNWNLTAGGVITRQVNGRPDDQANLLAPNAIGNLFKTFFNLVTGVSLPNGVPEFNESNTDTYTDLVNYMNVKNDLNVELEPDIFSFNCMGLSGRFFMGNDGEWKVISESNIKVEFDLQDPNNWTESLHQTVPQTVQEYIDVLSGFVLVDEYGTRYTFGYNDDAIEFSLPFFKQYDVNSQWIANSWYLTKVENVNGELLFDLKYERGYYIAHLIGNEHSTTYSCLQDDSWTSETTNGSKVATGDLISPVYLQSITTFENEEILFNSIDSDQLNYDFNNEYIVQASLNVNFPYLTFYPFNNLAYPGATSFDPLAGLKWRKLDHITVKRNGNEFRNVSLSYNDNSNERLFLESVIIKPTAGTTAGPSNSLVYGFEYKNKSSLPALLSKKVDHFGYATGVDYYSPTFTIGMDYAALQSLHYPTREPLFQTTENGILTKITYPTGGFTKLSYELNDYSYQVSNDRQSILNDITNPKTCGLRVKKMEMFDEPTSLTPTSSKEIVYKKKLTGRSSGVLALKPNYAWVDYLEPSAFYPDGGFKSSTFSNNILTPLGNMFESHIGYDEVSEVFDNGSYITYKYDTHRLIKDELPYVSFELNDYSPYAKFTDNSFLRGKQIDQTVYDAGGKPLERVTYKRRQGIRFPNQSSSYGITSNATLLAKCSAASTDFIYNGNVRKIYYYKDYVQEKITEYFRGGYLKKIEDYSVEIEMNNSNEYKYLTSTTINSEAESRTIQYTYPKDDISMADMVSKHMTNVLISQSVNGGAGGGSKWEYEIGSVIVPKFFYTQKEDGNWKLIQTLKYDNFNDTYPDKVKENTKPLDMKIFWGTGGEIGLIDKIEYEQRLWDNGYNGVRQLTSFIDHNGVESTFSYDGLGRLTFSDSNNGRLKNMFTYNYGLVFNGENIFTNELVGTDATGYKTEVKYDGLGREETNTKINYLDGGGSLTTSITYDNLGRVLTINDPTTGGSSLNTYENSPASIVEDFRPAGSPKSVKYKHKIEDNNFVVETTDEDGIVTRVFTDIFGRTSKTIDGLGNETKYTYNDRDQVLTIDPPGSGAIYTYTYYPDGKIWTKTIPDKGTYSYVYDQYDNIENETLANQKVIEYNYHGIYNDFLMSKEMDGNLIEEYLPYTDYSQDYIGAEKYSIHTNFGVLGQRHEIVNTSMDLDFGRPLTQQVSTIDGSYILELDYDNLGNLLSKKTTVNAFNTTRQSTEGWLWPKGIREKVATFNSGSIVGRSYLTYNGNDWLINENLGDNLQNIEYGYNSRGWLSSINSVGSIGGIGTNPCAETPDIPIPEMDCAKLSEIIQTFLIKYNCQELGDGTPTNLEIEINSQSFEDQLPLGVNSETISLPLNGATGNETTVFDSDIDFDINNGDSNSTIATGIYNVLLDCIDQNPDLLAVLEDLILNGLDNITTFTGGGPSSVTPNAGGINTNEPFFGMKIYYYTGNEKLEAKARYNGNISWMKWQVFGDIPHAYGFDYDENNRLVKAIYGEQKEENNCDFVKTDRYSVPTIEYDALGNIQNLTRRGLLNPEVLTGHEYGFTDKLTYEYLGSPNVVTSVEDEAEVDKGFVGGTANYGYDATGNMTSLSNKSLGIEYSFHDLPVKMTTDKGEITNYYTSTGIKLKSVFEPFEGYTDLFPKVTNYLANQEFVNSELNAIYWQEGRLTITKDEEEYLEYFLKDHLGNTRVRIADQNGDNLVYYNANDPENDELMSSHHYYPFGMEWDVPKFDKSGNSLQGTGEKTKYTYNGKELVSDLDINLHDFGFRYYDPAIARFTTIDPLTEDYVYQSGYAYAVNNPILFRDEFGLGVENEYVRDKETGELVQVGTEGGDEVDYVYEGTVHKDEDGNNTGATYSTDVETTEIHYVENEYSSGIDTRYTQDSDPTPGERNIHGSRPLDVQVYIAYFQLMSGGTTSAGKGVVVKSLGLKNMVDDGLRASTKVLTDINRKWNYVRARINGKWTKFNLLKKDPKTDFSKMTTNRGVGSELPPKIIPVAKSKWAKFMELFGNFDDPRM